MKIYLGSDHAGVKLRKRLVDHLRAHGHDPVDFGPESEASVDYPDWAARVGRAVRSESGSAGVLVCGSGIGVSMAANKLRGVRAAAPWNLEAARLSRAHNDANVICLGARLIPDGESLAMLDLWLETPFEGGRHAVRVAKITALELAEANESLVDAERVRLEARDVVRRIWAGDPRAFTPDTAHDKSIRNRLGWLRSPEEMSAPAVAARLTAFADEILRAGFKDAVLLGMGGSSLCPEVLAHTFGAGKGLRLQVLDSTDPDAVAAVERSIDLDRTLFVVSSKSGGTIEVRSFERFFWAKVLDRQGSPERAGTQFVAITDPGTQLEQIATDNKYRQIFRNPPDIGGRYSALSYFGLVPAALLGIDVAQLVGRAREMAASCRIPTVRENPGADLGARLGALAKAGRDKMTLVMSPELASLGSWIEQLVAESTGKLGKGIVPVDLEPLGPPPVYGPDHVFVVTQLAGGTPAASPEALQALRAGGHPVIELTLADRLDLGGEFFRWELATAIAGAVLEINPFDEPNVTEAKQATAKLLEVHARDKKLPAAAPATRPDDVAAILAHVDRADLGDYICLSAFFLSTPERHALLTRLRVACRQRRRVATTLGYGPRFLHSTGQLHKGGANNGVFIQLVAGSSTDLPVPGDTFSFGVLRDAQALGDFQVLEVHGRRALRVALGTDVEGNLERLVAALAARPTAP